MRSEGFSFNFGSLRVELCSPVVVFVSATVRKRPQPFASVRIQAWIVTFGESLVENVRFGSLACHFW